MRSVRRKKTHTLFFNNSKVKVRLVTLLFSLFVLVFGAITYFNTYSDMILDFKDDADYLESGISGNKVYVNDLKADYDYYMGLNYTSSDGNLPTTENKNIYNDGNLVQVKITYLSNDGNNKGYVSLNERQDTFIYYKTLVVNDNGTTDKSDDYIMLDLIDNPFTDRPNDKAFNGWFTSYRGASLIFDNEYYERKAKVPVSYDGDRPSKIDIVFKAKWTFANVQFVNDNFNTAINNLYDKGMRKIDVVTYTYGDLNMKGYFHSKDFSYGESYAGYYNANGVYQSSGYCRDWWNGCVYYQKIEDENFDVNGSYYELKNGSIQKVDNSTIERPINSIIVDKDFDGVNMSTYFRKINISRYGSLSGYYDSNGNYYDSGTCNNNTCDVYELINYYDDNGDEEIFDYKQDYYYLVTKDTNILVLNQDINSSWGNTAKDFTLTGINDGTSYNVTWNVNSAINCYSNITIENLKMYHNSRLSNYNPSSVSNTSGVLFGRYHNVKIGRGIKRNGTYPSLRAVVGGSGSATATGTGSNNNPTKYKLVIESGMYDSISLSTGSSSINYSNFYLNNKSVYGNDYDRVNKNNSNLDVYYCASGSWSGNIYSTTNSVTTNDPSFDLTVKSGIFGSNKYDYTTGIYVNGRRGGTHYAPTKVKVEGGYTYNLIGGPLPSENSSNVNVSYIYMTGGEVDFLVGGAGESATYGNRIIDITGGTINYSLFGGQGAPSAVCSRKKRS